MIYWFDPGRFYIDLTLLYPKSEFKFPIDSKLHVIFMHCFYLISQFFRCGAVLLQYFIVGKKIFSKSGCKLRKVGKHWKKARIDPSLYEFFRKM